MQGTAEKTNIGTDERQVLETVLDHPESTLSEIANMAKLLPPLTYEIVSSLRMRDLLSVREDDAGTRRYTVTAEAYEVLGKQPPEVKTPEAEDLEAEENRTERSHASALKRIEPLAEFPHALKEPEQRELVIKAIAEKYGTIDGIKRRVGFPMWFDTTELLAGMTVDHLIRKESKGDLAAYFRYNDKPLRFWRIGDGRIEFERDPDFVPRDEQAKAEELSGSPYVLYSEKKKQAAADVDDDGDDFDPDDDDAPIGRPADAFESKVIAQNGSSSEGKKNAPPRKARTGPYAWIELSAAAVEKATAVSKNIAGICAVLKLSQSAFYKKIDDSADLKAAYKRGLAMRSTIDATGEKKNGRPMNGDDRPVKSQNRPANGKSPDLDVDKVERLAREGKTAKEAAFDLGMSYFVFKNRLNAKKGPMMPIRDAWYRGRKAAGSPIKVDKRPAKAPHKTRDRSADIKPVAETVTTESSTDTLDKTPDRTNGHFPGEQVDHPVHYNRNPSGIECIDVVEHLSFNLGNAMKYIWRADEKGAAAVDIDKAIWYLEREKARRERATISV